jgi:hypothetical protein
VNLWMPGASYLLFWPLAFVLAGMLMSLYVGQEAHRSLKTWLTLLGCSPGIMIFTPFIKGLFIALTPNMIALVVLCLTLPLGLLVPLLAMMGSGTRLASVALLSGFAALAMGSLTAGFDADHPRQQSLFYALNAQEKRAFWLSADKELSQWASAFFALPNKPQQLPEIFGDNAKALWAKPAPLLALPPPIVETLEDRTISGQRKLTIRVKSIRQAPKLKVTVEGVGVLQSTVGGQPYPQDVRSRWQLNAVGLGKEGLIIGLVVEPGRPFIVRVIDISQGLGQQHHIQLPKIVIDSPAEFSDADLVANVKRYR